MRSERRGDATSAAACTPDDECYHFGDSHQYAFESACLTAGTAGTAHLAQHDDGIGCHRASELGRGTVSLTKPHRMRAKGKESAQLAQTRKVSLGFSRSAFQTLTDGYEFKSAFSREFRELRNKFFYFWECMFDLDAMSFQVCLVSNIPNMSHDKVAISNVAWPPRTTVNHSLGATAHWRRAQ
eukprot:3881085-Prymnesium_polylepis.1